MYYLPPGGAKKLFGPVPRRLQTSLTAPLPQARAIGLAVQLLLDAPRELAQRHEVALGPEVVLVHVHRESPHFVVGLAAIVVLTRDDRPAAHFVRLRQF